MIDGGKIVIRDYAERYGINFSPGKLMCCVGDLAVRIGLKQLRRLVVQPTQKSNNRRKTHKTSAMKVKEKLQENRL